jgi:hypothetical protein
MGEQTCVVWSSTRWPGASIGFGEHISGFGGKWMLKQEHFDCNESPDSRYLRHQSYYTNSFYLIWKTQYDSSLSSSSSQPSFTSTGSGSMYEQVVISQKSLINWVNDWTGSFTQRESRNLWISLTILWWLIKISKPCGGVFRHWSHTPRNCTHAEHATQTEFKNSSG